MKAGGLVEREDSCQHFVCVLKDTMHVRYVLGADLVAGRVTA
jgi:hypothetical protein